MKKIISVVSEIDDVSDDGTIRFDVLDKNRPQNPDAGVDLRHWKFFSGDGSNGDPVLDARARQLLRALSSTTKNGK